MAGPETQKDATENNAPQHSASKPAATQAPAPAPAPSAGPAATPAPSFTATRPLYIPQFTAATQMILKRMKGEPSSLSAALSQASRSPSVTASIPSATYEDVRRRLVLGMNTSTQMTMQMPAAPPVRPLPLTVPAPKPAAPKASSSTAGMSAIRKVTAGLTAPSKPTPVKAPAPKTLSSESKIKKPKPTTAPRGPKRKRTKTADDSADEASSTTSSSSISSTPEPSSTHPDNTTTTNTTTTTQQVLLTMTKSGRQVLKPAAYNPAAMDAASRRAQPRHHYGKRTAEQALCRRCSRMHSPAANQIVFCDGCNEGWHQRCHDPWVGDEFVRDEGRSWFCRGCVSKRERQVGGNNKRVKVEHQQQQGGSNVSGRGVVKGEREKESWASKPAVAKRAYLSTLPQQELVALLMACLEAHPDLPIFPASLGGDHHHAPRSIFAGTTTEGLFPRAEAHPTGQLNYVRKIAANGGGKAGKGRSASGGKGSGQKEESQERMNEEDEEFDPLAALWPRAGMGLYARLPPDTEDDARLVDVGDFEAFSVIVYDERGRKVEENGMKV